MMNETIETYYFASFNYMRYICLFWLCYYRCMHKIVKFLTDPSIIKFLVVGIVSFGVDYGMLLILHNMFAVELIAATTVAFLTGLVINFTLNKYWTFGAPGGAKQSTRQAMEYGMLVVANLLFTNVFISSLASIHLGPEITKPITTGVVMVTNYVVYRLIIFREKPVAEQ